MSQTFKKWVLYVNYDRRDGQRMCAGSRRIMAMVEGIREDVNVQNISELQKKGVTLPEWLNGSPILVDTETKQAFKGTSAVTYVESLTRKPSPPVHSEMTGILSKGEQHLHADNDLDDFGPLTDGEAADDVRDGKVTDDDLQKYLAQRNKGQGGGGDAA